MMEGEESEMETGGEVKAATSKEVNGWNKDNNVLFHLQPV